MWNKVVSIWKYTKLHYMDEFDWFYIAGDDTYLIPENLRYFLANDPIVLKKRARRQGLYVGRRHRLIDINYIAHVLKEQVKLNSFTKMNENHVIELKEKPITFYNAGGPGYVLDSVALEKFAAALMFKDDKIDGCFTNLTISSEDVFTAYCLAKVCDIYPIDTRDVDGLERFHHFEPHTLNMDMNDIIKKFGQKFYDFWSSSAVNFKSGTNFSAPDTISFHWLSNIVKLFQTHVAIRICKENN